MKPSGARASNVLLLYILRLFLFTRESNPYASQMHVREDSGAVEPETEIQIQKREHLRGRGAPIFIYAPFLTQPQAIKHSRKV